MAAPYLTLQLSDKTLKKLRALAMLSGSTVDQLEKDFADYFDQMLTENIAELLAQLDGKEYVAPASDIQRAGPAPERQESPEEVVASVAANAVEHALSEDDLPEEVKSVEEQVEDEIQPPQFEAPNAGNNAESFLDAALSSPQPRAQAQQAPTQTYMGMPLRGVKKAFNPNVPRARVSEYTGEEADLL